MNTKINEHRPTPKSIEPYRHSSGTVRSPNDAGGEVPRDQYSNQQSAKGEQK